MSNFHAIAIDPRTDEEERVMMLDNYFGPRIYGVKFPDGTIYHEDDVTILREAEP